MERGVWGVERGRRGMAVASCRKNTLDNAATKDGRAGDEEELKKRFLNASCIPLSYLRGLCLESAEMISPAKDESRPSSTPAWKLLQQSVAGPSILMCDE